MARRNVISWRTNWFNNIYDNFSYKKKQNIFELANLLAFCSPIGIFLGRIANFINGELIGRATDGSWGVKYKFVDQPRHPSQIYEAFLKD